MLSGNAAVALRKQDVAPRPQQKADHLGLPQQECSNCNLQIHHARGLSKASLLLVDANSPTPNDAFGPVYWVVALLAESALKDVAAEITDDVNQDHLLVLSGGCVRRIGISSWSTTSEALCVVPSCLVRTLMGWKDDAMILASDQRPERFCSHEHRERSLRSSPKGPCRRVARRLCSQQWQEERARDFQGIVCRVDTGHQRQICVPVSEDHLLLLRGACVYLNGTGR
ncbi:hypothetical protein HPB50_010915 [Hyalomma asiaticum]|uniref:Uncharacterized protein n=1 Tax=Hyalomma asiaticum TaxID=266040 RepID=A0ACB7RN44_HYAAI|nr:hypothetical protein HPB50_010915 [Hyalomma asiaticum]